MNKPSQETWLAYMEQAEGMIRDQQELIEVQRQTLRILIDFMNQTLGDNNLTKVKHGQDN